MTTEPDTISPETVAADEAANHSETPNSSTPDLTAPPIDLSPSELKDLEIARLKDELAAMKKDKASSVSLAEEAESARRDWEDLKSRTKTAKDRYGQSLEALSKQVRGEVQTEMNPTDADQGTIQFATGGGPTVDEAANLDAITIDGLDWSAMEQHVLSALVSTGKPQRVKPVTIMGLDYVLVNVQRRVGIFHQVMDGEAFVNTHKVEGAVRPDERSTELEQLGEYAGLPVKVGRKTMHLAANPLLVRMPPDAANVVTATDDGPNPVGNRMVAHLKSSGVEQITVDALAKLLGVERDIVQRTASEDARLVYSTGDELVSLA